MENIKSFLRDNKWGFAIFLCVMATAYIYGQTNSKNGLPSCTDNQIISTFSNVVLSDVMSIGFHGPKPDVSNFQSISYDENANYCKATVTIVIGDKGSTFDTIYKVYREEKGSNSYKVGFVEKGD